MFKRNAEIRVAKGKIPNWVIAERLGIHENTYYQMMRKELPIEKKQEILQIITSLKDFGDG